MIEAIALLYYAAAAYGATAALSYWLATSIIAWLLMGHFTRGRNEDLEELLRAGAEEPPVQYCAPLQDPAALAAAQRPSIRRSRSGHRLEMCAELPRSVNPWVNATWRVTAAERLKMALLAPWLLPCRFTFLLVAACGASFFATVATIGWGTRPRSGESVPLTTPPDDARMPRWRRVLGLPVLLFVRLALLALGFWRVDVRGRDRLDPKARVLVCNHLSMVEPLVLLIETHCTPVTVSAFAQLPALGAVGRLHQLIWLERGDPASRTKVVEAIHHRTRPQATEWPPVLVFPEGTTINGRALISFKPGAFSPRAVVQPAVARFPFAVRCGCGLDPSWCTAGPQFGELSLRMMLQPWNRVHVDFLETIEPIVNEATPAFSSRVRNAMAEALGVPVTDHSWADMWLNMTARQLGLPPHRTLVQLKALQKALPETPVERLRAADALKRFADADRQKHGKLSVEQFRAALRGDSAAKREDLRLDDTTLDALFAKLGGGSEDIDFFSFLVGFAVLDALHADGSDGALDLVFSLLDADGVGRVPRSRVDVALQLRADDASIRDDAFISVDALEPAAEDPLLDADAFRAHVRANRERLSRAWRTSADIV